MTTTEIISTVINGSLWTMGIILVFTLIYFFYLSTKFKMLITIKDVRNGGKRVINDKARLVIRDGVTYWRLQKLKKEIIPPPEETIEITTKGKDYGMFYRVDDDTFIPIKDTFNWEDTKNDKDFMSEFRPLPTNQKAALINQYKKVERDRKKSITDLVSQAMPFIAIIMILTIFMIFFGEVISPIQDLSSSTSASMDKMSDVITKLDAVINDKQIITTTTLNNITGGVVPN